MSLSHLVLLHVYHHLLQACLCSAHHCAAMPLVEHAKCAHTGQTCLICLKLLNLLQCKNSVQYMYEQQSNKGCSNMLGPIGHSAFACNELHQQLTQHNHI